MTLNHAAQSGSHSYEDRDKDFYETPVVATAALLRVEKLPLIIWEPAAGNGAIVRVLRAAGHDVVTSDIVERDFSLGFVADFLTVPRVPYGVETIITNPPYRWAELFVDKALRVCPKVIMLLRLAFLESEKRSYILEGRGLKHIYVFRNRLPMMHREGWEGPKASSGMAFAWYVWDRNWKGSTTIQRISWEKTK